MLKYKIALLNVWWDENSEDTRFFDSISTQKLYFDGLTSGLFSPLVNFNMGDNITTSCYVKDVTGRTPEELCKCNYAVIIKLNEEEQETERRYFFAKCSQDSSTQMFVQLNLDDIQTNYIPNRNNLNECIIKRAHLNRWLENEDNTITFDNSLNSDLFINEDLQINQIVKSREKIKINYYEDEVLSNWLDEHILYWVYIFVDPNHTYKMGDFQNIGNLTNYNGSLKQFSSNSEASETGVLFYPIFKRGEILMKREYQNNTYIIDIGSLGEREFRENNNNVEYYFSKKISPILKEKIVSYTINGDTLTINSNAWYGPTMGIVASDDSNFKGIPCSSYQQSNVDYRCFGCFGSGQDFITTESEFEINEKFTFNKNEIISQDANIIHDPKILSNNFKKLSLVMSDGNSFDYDIQLIGNKDIKFLYSEIIIPEITKYYSRLKSIGLYLSPTDKNYNGIVGSVDNSIAVVNDAYSNFIANNKNYWLQSTGAVIGGLATSIVGGLTGNIPLAVGGLVAGVTTGVKGFLSYDNVKNQKSQKDNASGNILFNSNIMELGLYVEIYSGLESDLKTAYNYFLKYGYKYGKLGKISDFDNIRALYNYISVEFDNININISNKEKERLKNKLNSIRFWNSDLIKYNKENYERWLTNGNI